jgi:hypothetical protein
MAPAARQRAPLAVSVLFYKYFSKSPEEGHKRWRASGWIPQTAVSSGCRQRTARAGVRPDLEQLCLTLGTPLFGSAMILLNELKVNATFG